MKTLIGRKIGMTQLFNGDGTVLRVTLVQAGPCFVAQVKSTENDGYEAVQLGFEVAKNPHKPQVGHAKTLEATPKVFKEFRLPGSEAKVGDQVTVEDFDQGDNVVVVGVSKGKGFAGTVKRHNFATGPKTHGSHNHRAPGSIGAGFPQHVFKGMRMAGRMGGDRTTIKNIVVAFVDPKTNIIALKGSVPGPNKGIVTLQGTAA